MATDKKTRRNEDITAREVRVVGSEGDQIGVMAIRDALARAGEEGMDLVEIAPQAEPPVCRIMDWGKYRFEQSKKAQAARKKQKQVQIKEVKFRPGTDDHDYDVKMRNLRRFIEEGDKVKVTLRFRGREMAHQELGLEILQRVEKDMAEETVVEQRPRMEGRQMVMMLSPKKTS
ncbi:MULTISPECIES: translation initiation factor IF-3 [unclassified Wenzhouxiangella]|uniref:translation initiation factor IF-3 n=1 Tax=unclassified Wenzhouxiangella TaxID=2613841 RepID=UPI000E3260BD|nr:MULTISPECIES: translation initiation factor IF-3 [unclassified Wenzhouxiangella]RFF28004.1 translation initiation factor IF-3 [Wenzhouxiangella sp. 15181]RFP68591.1 translation initiation factor IF-3 [Wenzhouxiangella sp. 15190]